jgi:dienelactone hydrolase
VSEAYSQKLRVNFPSQDEELTGGAPTTVPAVLLRPAGEGPFGAIVLLHGCGGLFRGPRDLDWGLRLQTLGLVVLMPDSFGPRGVSEVCTGAYPKVRASRERVGDAYGALAYLQALPFVRTDRVGIIGWSHGGGAVLHAMAMPSLPSRIRGDFRVAIAFYPPCRRLLERRDFAPRAPLTILIGEDDDWSPAAPCVSLAERDGARDTMSVVTYPGALHDFDAPDMPVHVRRGVRTGSGTATLGTDPAARAAAIEVVTAIVRRDLAAAGEPPEGAAHR